jgi:hypothetical protein
LWTNTIDKAMMKFVPIPTTDDAIRATSRLWLPFLVDISKRNREPIERNIDLVVSHAVHIGIVWDDEAKEATALVGMQFKEQGEDNVGEIYWTTGKGMKRWRHLIADVERYFKEHCGCQISRPLCRPGWAPMLKSAGYKTTHYVMERRL